MSTLILGGRLGYFVYNEMRFLFTRQTDKKVTEYIGEVEDIKHKQRELDKRTDIDNKDDEIITREQFIDSLKKVSHPDKQKIDEEKSG